MTPRRFSSLRWTRRSVPLTPDAPPCSDVLITFVSLDARTFVSLNSRTFVSLNSRTFVSLNSRLESNKEGEEDVASRRFHHVPTARFAHRRFSSLKHSETPTFCGIMSCIVSHVSACCPNSYQLVSMLDMSACWTCQHDVSMLDTTECHNLPVMKTHMVLGRFDSEWHARIVSHTMRETDTGFPPKRRLARAKFTHKTLRVVRIPARMSGACELQT